jgi:DNA-directed RNA polymerase specialized sigma24 family protein
MFAQKLGRPAQPLEPFGMTGQDYSRLDAAVRQLPQIPRMVCVMRYQHGKTARAGGEALGCGATAYGRYLSDAHRIIAGILDNGQ